MKSLIMLKVIGQRSNDKCKHWLHYAVDAFWLMMIDLIAKYKLFVEPVTVYQLGEFFNEKD